MEEGASFLNFYHLLMECAIGQEEFGKRKWKFFGQKLLPLKRLDYFYSGLVNSLELRV